MARDEDTEYTERKGLLLCELVSGGRTLHSIADLRGYPRVAVMHRWLRNYPKFQTSYDIARHEGCDAIVDEMLEIADFPYAKDDIVDPLKHAALKIKTRQWIAEKLHSSKYGAKTTVDLPTVNITIDGKDVGL